jgi:hypothetical protein
MGLGGPSTIISLLLDWMGPLLLIPMGLGGPKKLICTDHAQDHVRPPPQFGFSISIVDNEKKPKYFLRADAEEELNTWI